MACFRVAESQEFVDLRKAPNWRASGYDSYRLVGLDWSDSSGRLVKHGGIGPTRVDINSHLTSRRLMQVFPLSWLGGHIAPICQFFPSAARKAAGCLPKLPFRVELKVCAASFWQPVNPTANRNDVLGIQP